jgi:hypothetical protein
MGSVSCIPELSAVLPRKTLRAATECGLPDLGAIDRYQPEVRVGTPTVDSCRARFDSPSAAPFAAGVGERSDRTDPMPQTVPGLRTKIKRVVCSRRDAASRASGYSDRGQRPLSPITAARAVWSGLGALHTGGRIAGWATGTRTRRVACPLDGAVPRLRGGVPLRTGFLVLVVVSTLLHVASPSLVSRRPRHVRGRVHLLLGGQAVLWSNRPRKAGPRRLHRWRGLTLVH